MIVEERHRQTVLLRLDRPPANALSNDLIIALRNTFERLAVDGQARAVVLTGSGSRFFSAGGDIKELDTLSVDAGRDRLAAFDAVLEGVARFPGPYVCAVNGYAVGGGFELCLFADHVLAVPGARFGFPEINHGILPIARGMNRAVRTLGLRTARRLLYTGELIEAEEALALGVIDELVPATDLIERALETAHALGGKGASLFAAIKHTLNAGEAQSGEQLRALDSSAFESYFQTDEMRAGVQAFRDRA